MLEGVDQELLRQLPRLLGQGGLSDTAYKRAAKCIRLLVLCCTDTKTPMLNELESELHKCDSPSCSHVRHSWWPIFSQRSHTCATAMGRVCRSCLTRIDGLSALRGLLAAEGQESIAPVWRWCRLSGEAVRELRSMVAGTSGSGPVVNMGVGALGSRVLCICEVIGALINPKGVKDQTPLVQVHTHPSLHIIKVTPCCPTWAMVLVDWALKGHAIHQGMGSCSPLLHG